MFPYFLLLERGNWKHLFYIKKSTIFVMIWLDKGLEVLLSASLFPMLYMLAYPKYLIVYGLFESYIFLCIVGRWINASIGSNVWLSIFCELNLWQCLICCHIQSLAFEYILHCWNYCYINYNNIFWDTSGSCHIAFFSKIFTEHFWQNFYLTGLAALNVYLAGLYITFSSIFLI